MRGQRYWVVSTRFEAVDQTIDTSPAESDAWLHREGRVRLTTGSLGTEVKWDVQSPCHSALFTTMDLIQNMQPPFVLRFCAMGWFEAVCDDAGKAIQRIEDVIAHGDRHFAARIFVRQVSPQVAKMPDVIKFSLESQTAPDDYTVDCFLDHFTSRFVVRRVGPKSAIGRVWGTFTSSQPCQPAGGYGDTVSAAYAEVVETGQPRYDQVVALLRMPDGAHQWVPYHRVVLPSQNTTGPPSVAVVSQIAAVNFRVL